MKIPVVANLRQTLRHAEFIVVCAFRLIPFSEHVATFISGVFVTSRACKTVQTVMVAVANFCSRSKLIGNQDR